MQCNLATPFRVALCGLTLAVLCAAQPGLARMFARGGARELSAVHQESNATGDWDDYQLYHPRLARFSDGGFLAAWHWQFKEWDDQQYVYHKAIQGRVLDVRGAPLGQVLDLHQYNVSPPGSDRTLDLVALPRNRALGVWPHYVDGEDSLEDIAFRVFDVNGTPLTDETKANAYLPAIQKQPRAAALTGGGAAIVWTSPGHGDDTFSTGIYARFLDANLDFASAEIEVNTYAGGRTSALFGPQESQEFCDVAGLLDGACVAVWQTYTDSWDISLQRLSDNGARLGSEIRVNTTLSDNQMYPAVAGLEDGGFIVVWQHYDASESRTEIRGRRFNALGGALGDDFALSASASSQTRPEVTALPGGWVAVWVENGRATARRFDAQSQPLEPAFALHGLTGADAMPSLAIDGDQLLVPIFSHTSGLQGDGAVGVEELSVQSRAFSSRALPLQGAFGLLAE